MEELDTTIQRLPEEWLDRIRRGEREVVMVLSKEHRDLLRRARRQVQRIVEHWGVQRAVDVRELLFRLRTAPLRPGSLTWDPVTGEDPKPVRQNETRFAPKYTPGPWAAERHGFVAATVGGKRLQVAAALGQVALHGDPTIEPEEIQTANARLIAAAPDLLEACGMALAVLRDCGPSWAAEEIARIESAIAKARGE